MILEILYGDLLQDLVMKCAKFCYESYFEYQIMKSCSVMIYHHLKQMSCCILQHEAFNECRDPKLCFTCLINGCYGVKKSPFLRAFFFSSISYLFLDHGIV